MRKKKVLLTGASGMLGHHMCNAFAHLPDVDLITVSRSNMLGVKNHIICDIANLKNFDDLLCELKPDHVFHCAANTNVDLCEKRKDYTFSLHVGTAELIASKTFIKHSWYISTDSVFDGTQGNYYEYDKKNPLNFYAKTKSLAEDCFKSAGHTSTIVRTNIIGYSLPFKRSLFEWALNSLDKGDEISGYTNVKFNPLFVKSLSNIIVSIYSQSCDSFEEGIYHFGCSGYYSKYNFLKMISKVFGFDESLIVPVTADTNVNGALRPLDTTLNIEKTEKRLHIQFPTLEQEVETMFKELKENNGKKI